MCTDIAFTDNSIQHRIIVTLRLPQSNSNVAKFSKGSCKYRPDVKYIVFALMFAVCDSVRASARARAFDYFIKLCFVFCTV